MADKKQSRDDRGHTTHVSNEADGKGPIPVRDALADYFDNLIDIFEAEAVMERVQKGEEKTYPLEEVEKSFPDKDG